MQKMPNPNSPSVRGPDRRTNTRARDTSDSLDRLLDGAQLTFAERGYRAAKIHEICARASVGIGTFYSHFDHKRELLQRVCVERMVILGTSMTPDILRDHAQLMALLRIVVDEPVASGLLRAWYEAVLEEPEIARFHTEWRTSTLKVLATTVAQAQKGPPAHGPRLEPAVVAWSMVALSRELAIYERTGAPDIEGLARLIEELAFGPVIAG